MCFFYVRVPEFQGMPLQSTLEPWSYCQNVLMANLFGVSVEMRGAILFENQHEGDLVYFPSDWDFPLLCEGTCMPLPFPALLVVSVQKNPKAQWLIPLLFLSLKTSLHAFLVRFLQNRAGGKDFDASSLFGKWFQKALRGSGE